MDEIEVIEPKNCLEFVTKNYSLEVVAVMYENFLRRCYEYVSGKDEYSKGISHKLDLREKGCQYV